MPFQGSSHRKQRWNDMSSAFGFVSGNRDRTQGALLSCLLSQSEFCDQRGVALGVLVLEIGQETLALVDHLQQTAPAVMVLGVGLEVGCQFIDACGEQRNLNLGAASVGGATGVGLDDVGRLSGGKRHGGRDFLSSWKPPRCPHCMGDHCLRFPVLTCGHG